MRKFLAIFCGLFLAWGLAHAEGDAAAGKSKATTCFACHGQDGIGTTPIYPNLAGQKQQYLELAIKAYKEKQRSGGNAAVMYPMVGNLSEQDIADLAAYYSSLPAGE